jgi:hypothetical protein
LETKNVFFVRQELRTFAVQLAKYQSSNNKQVARKKLREQKRKNPKSKCLLEVPLGDIQGAVPGLPVTHAVIHAPGKVKSQGFRKKNLCQEVDFYLFLKPLKLAHGMKSLASREPTALVKKAFLLVW